MATRTLASATRRVVDGFDVTVQRHELDGGVPHEHDAGPGPSDAGPGPSDAGPGPSDAGPGPSDAGPRPNEIGPPADAGPKPPPDGGNSVPGVPATPRPTPPAGDKPPAAQPSQTPTPAPAPTTPTGQPAPPAGGDQAPGGEPKPSDEGNPVTPTVTEEEGFDPEVGEPNSAERRAYVNQQFWSGFGGGAVQGAAMGFGLGMFTAVAQWGVPRLVPKLATVGAAKAAGPIGAVIGGGIAAWALWNKWKDRKAVWESISKVWAPGAPLADRLMGIAEIVDIIGNVVDVIAGIAGLGAILMWAGVIPSFGATSPMAVLLTKVATVGALVGMALSVIKTGLQLWATLLRREAALEADPQSVKGKVKEMQDGAKQVGAFAGGLAGAGAAAGVSKGLGLTPKEPGSNVGADINQPPATRPSGPTTVNATPKPTAPAPPDVAPTPKAGGPDAPKGPEAAKAPEAPKAAEAPKAPEGGEAPKAPAGPEAPPKQTEAPAGTSKDAEVPKAPVEQPPKGGPEPPPKDIDRPPTDGEPAPAPGRPKDPAEVAAAKAKVDQNLNRALSGLESQRQAKHKLNDRRKPAVEEIAGRHEKAHIKGANKRVDAEQKFNQSRHEAEMKAINDAEVKAIAEAQAKGSADSVPKIQEEARAAREQATERLRQKNTEAEARAEAARTQAEQRAAKMREDAANGHAEAKKAIDDEAARLKEEMTKAAEQEKADLDRPPAPAEQPPAPPPPEQPPAPPPPDQPGGPPSKAPADQPEGPPSQPPPSPPAGPPPAPPSGPPPAPFQPRPIEPVPPSGLWDRFARRVDDWAEDRNQRLDDSWFRHLETAGKNWAAEIVDMAADAAQLLENIQKQWPAWYESTVDRYTGSFLSLITPKPAPKPEEAAPPPAGPPADAGPTDAGPAGEGGATPEGGGGAGPEGGAGAEAAPKEPVTEPVQPAYPPAPGSTAQVDAMTTEITGLQHAKEQADANTKFARDEEAGRAATAPKLANAIAGADAAVSSSQKDEAEVAKTKQENTTAKQVEGEAEAKAGESGSKFGEASIIVGILNAVQAAASIFTLRVLPERARAMGRNLMEGADKVKNDLTAGQAAVEQQKASLPARKAQLESESQDLQQLTGQAPAVTQQWTKAKADMQATAQGNAARQQTAQQFATRNEGISAESADRAQQTAGARDELVSRLEAWAVEHRQARADAVEQKKKDLEERGYVVTGVENP